MAWPRCAVGSHRRLEALGAGQQDRHACHRPAAVGSRPIPDMSLRVLLVNQPIDGGVAFHVETLAQRLPEHGVGVTVACPPSPWSERLAATGTTVIAVPMVREISPRIDLAGLRRLRAALRQAEF